MEVKIVTRIGRVNYLVQHVPSKATNDKYIFSSHLLFGRYSCLIALSQANQAGIHG